MKESHSQFEQRKRDHIRIALDPKSQTEGQSGLDSIELIHEALPDMDFEEVEISASFSFQKQSLSLSSPIFISSMTAGHAQGESINRALARLSDRRQILMGVGSQRKELSDSNAALEWKKVREQAPNARLIGNIGISQLIKTPLRDIQNLVEGLEACALFIHLNPLQEVIQPEGTPQFKGGLKAIAEAAKSLSVPVIIKEVGSGFSVSTLQRLQEAGVAAVDVSGKGGTHWGRVETYRSLEESSTYQVGQTFANWGISTVQSLMNAKTAQVGYEVWASGGVRNGLDVAKLCALGAQKVGMAQPFLMAALAGCEQKDGTSDKFDDEKSDLSLNVFLDRMELELKTALFCTGARTLRDLESKLST